MSTLRSYGIRIALLVWAAASLPAQGISNVTVSHITYSSVNINWNTTTGQSSLIQYGTTAALGSNQDEKTPVSTTEHHQYLSGLSANTTYYYKVCNNISSCDPTIRTFVTAAAPVPLPDLPIATTRLTVPPKPVVPANQRFTVAADCSDFQTRINAVAQLDGNLNYEILIPVNADCAIASNAGAGDANASSFYLPAKSGPNPNGTGEIIIRSAAADSELPPEGSRVDSSFYSRMPTLRNNVWGVRELSSPNSNGTCTSGQLWWDFIASLSNSWALKACTSPSTNGYTLVARTSFSGTPPSSCTPSTWYYRTDTSSSANGIYWCAPAGKLYRMQLGRYFAFTFNANAHHYRFLGIQFSVVPFTNPHPAFLNAYGTDGSYYVGHFQLPTSVHHIIFDRCRLTALDYPQRVQQLVNSEASSVAFLGNYIDQISYWLPDSNAGSGQTETQIFNLTGGDQLLFDNNYVEGTGFGIIATDDTTGMPTNVVITRNEFAKPPRYRYQSTENTAATGKFYHARHCIELKSGERWVIDGNICDGNFTTVNAAHFIALSPRAGSTSSRKMQDIQITNNTLRNGPGGVYVIGHNDVTFSQMTVARRIMITNNLLLGLDGYLSGVSGSARPGHCFTVQFGAEDITLRHNMCRDNNGVWPAFLWEQYGPSAGLDFRDNIVWHKWANGYGGLVTPGCALGTASLACGWNGWRMERNALINISGQSPSTYPSNNFWQTAESGLLMEDPAAGKYRLLKTSPFRSGAAVVSGVSGPASDGASMGPNHYDLERAQGIVGPVAVRAGDQHATFTFSSSHTGSCVADVSPDATFATGVIRASGAPGTSARMIAASGLTAGTVYYYRIICGGRKTGSFQTASSGGGSTSFTVVVKPPVTWSSITSAVAEFGTTTGLGSFTASQACVGGCTLYLSGTTGRATYYRVLYRNASSQTVARSGILSTIP